MTGIVSMQCCMGWVVVGTLWLCSGCGVEALATEEQGIAEGAAGVLVVNTDYHSTSVSAVSPTGEVLSRHLISSASARPGLSSALSGDVVLPTVPPVGSEMVLIDRYPAAVLTWLNLETAEVRAQLSVATGFASNPHDYVQVSDSKAYVPRFSPNLNAGDEPFDAGHDVLIVDPSVPEVTGRIELMPALQSEAAKLFPRADRAILAGGLLRVLVVVFDAAFRDRAASRLVSIDPVSDDIVGVHIFDGLTSCSMLSLAPSGEELAVACNGAFNQSGEGDYRDSAIVRLRLAQSTLTEERRYPAADLGAAQVSALSYTSENALLFTTYGRFTADRSGVELHDTLRWLDLESGRVSEPLLETRRVPFSLGDVVCRPEQAVCFVTDAETRGGVLHRFEIRSSGEPSGNTSIVVDRTTGLPPRYLSWLRP